MQEWRHAYVKSSLLVVWKWIDGLHLLKFNLLSDFAMFGSLAAKIGLASGFFIEEYSFLIIYITSYLLNVQYNLMQLPFK